MATLGPTHDQDAVDSTSKPIAPPGPSSGVDIRRLHDSIEWSQRQMAPFRRRYVECVTAYAGSRFGQQATEKTPYNILRLAVDIWLRQLVSQTPQCLIIGRTPAVTTQAYELELALNHTLTEIDFGETLAAATRCGLFWLGGIKVGISAGDPKMSDGRSRGVGTIYADMVLPEDIVFDMNARGFGDWEWVGHRYRVPLEWARNNPAFSSDIKKRLTASERGSRQFGEESAKTSDLSQTEGPKDTELEPYIDLLDIFVPGYNTLVTLAADQRLPPLQEIDWIGPKGGPLHLFSLGNVPGSPMPLAPAQQLYDLQILLNNLFNKLGRQALRQKTLTIVDGPAERDGTATKVRDAFDGEMISSNHIDGVRAFNTGDISQQGMQFVGWIKEIMSYLGGNIETMGGLTTQAETLGQEQLLMQTSSQLLIDMQNRLMRFTRNVMQDIGWYLYSDPLLELDLQKYIQGYGTIPFTWTPERRRKDYMGYNLELHPHSLQSKSPTERLGGILQIVREILMPLAPQLGAWGKELNVDHLLYLVNKYGDYPELSELVISTEVPSASLEMSEQENAPRPSERPLQSPNTTRNYVRRNISGSTGQAEINKALATQATRGASSSSAGSSNPSGASAG